MPARGIVLIVLVSRTVVLAIRTVIAVAIAVVRVRAVIAARAVVHRIGYASRQATGHEQDKRKLFHGCLQGLYSLFENPWWRRVRGLLLRDVRFVKSPH